MKTTPSILSPYTEQITALRKQGVSYRNIAEMLTAEHGLRVSHNAVFKFVQSLENNGVPGTLFYEGLPDDLRDSLLKQITALWTFDSTGIEGNTLTLGETIKVLELGLTISGKPLKDHEEVYGHAKAIDLIYDLIRKDKIQPEDLFNLHRCVMQKSPIDCQRPIGDWKRDYNGTTGVKDGKPVYMEYASPSETPKLMARWIKEFNRKLHTATTPAKAINVYAWAHLTFVRIHPFFDGNGRVARLIANLPLLRCGQPPLMISIEQRLEYIDLLWSYQNATGVIRAKDRLLPPHQSITAFKQLLRSQWKETRILIEKTRELAITRKTEH
jgi:Fic family protein